MFSSPSSSYDACAHNLSLLKDGLEEFGVQTDIFYLGDSLFKRPHLIQPLNIPFFLDLMRNHEITIGWDTSASYVAGIANTLVNSRIVFCVRGIPIEQVCLTRANPLSLKGNYLIFQSMITEKIAMKYSDYLVTCSEPLRQYYIHKGVDQKRVKTIRNGVDTELFKPKEERRDNEHFTVMYAGAFQKWQGIDNLILAAKLLDADNIRFKIVGFTNRDLVFKKKTERMLGDKAELIERLPQTELVDQINSSDVCVIPRSDVLPAEVAFPTKFAEYIAVGKPVIVTKVGEISDYVKKYDCGFVCEPTVESIANTIRKAKDTPPEILLKMGMNGRQLAETEFDQRKISKQYFDFLSEIV